MKKNNQTDETTTENYNQISSRFASDMKTKKRRGPRKSYKNRRLNVDPFLLQQQIKQKLSTDTLWASDVKFTWKKTVADSNNGKKGSSFLFATARPKYSSDFKVYCPPTVDFDHHGNNSINDSTSKTWAFNTNSNETTKSNVNGELNYDINSMRKDNYNYNYQTLNNNYITKNNSNNFTTTQNTLNTQNDRNHHYNNYNNYNNRNNTEISHQFYHSEPGEVPFSYYSNSTEIENKKFGFHSQKGAKPIPPNERQDQNYTQYFYGDLTKYQKPKFYNIHGSPSSPQDKVTLPPIDNLLSGVSEDSNLTQFGHFTTSCSY